MVGDITSRNRGSLVGMETGVTTSMRDNLQERNSLRSPVNPSTADGTLRKLSRQRSSYNPSKRNADHHRSATKDMTTVLDVPRIMTIDTALEWISDDELVEVTPLNVRIRKMILNADERKKARAKAGIVDSEEDE